MQGICANTKATQMTKPIIKFDHLVVAATTLEIGATWVQDRLGVSVPFGGIHDHMGTHNCLGQLTPTTFLEIIATNPDATPDRTRWFSMDEPEFHQRLTNQGAFLHHWVINSSDIDQTLSNAHHDAGPAIQMTRGRLNWQICVRDDGRLTQSGIIPTVIEWPNIAHPAGTMADLGLLLNGVQVHTPSPADTLADLAAIGAAEFCSLHRSAIHHLSASFLKDGKHVTL